MLPNTPSSHDSNFSEDAETKLIPSLHNHFRQRQRSVPKHTDLLPTSRTKSAGKEQVMQRFYNILVTRGHKCIHQGADSFDEEDFLYLNDLLEAARRRISAYHIQKIPTSI